MTTRRWLSLGLGVLALEPACYFETSCVAEGALVATPQGLRAIERLRVGDAIWAVDPHTMQRVATRIAAIRSATRECLALQLGAGALECTPDHPIYSASSRTYVPAVRFLEGRAHEILRVDEDGARVEPVLAVRSDVGLRRVFDLTVESQHHNFVANGVLVHNKSPSCEIGDPDCTGIGGSTDLPPGDTTEGTADGSTGDGGSTGADETIGSSSGGDASTGSTGDDASTSSTGDDASTGSTSDDSSTGAGSSGSSSGG